MQASLSYVPLHTEIPASPWFQPACNLLSLLSTAGNLPALAALGVGGGRRQQGRHCSFRHSAPGPQRRSARSPPINCRTPGPPAPPCSPPFRAAMLQHTASDVYNDQQLFFQILVLERQLYCWIGLAPARLSTLCLATPTPLVRAAARRLHARLFVPAAPAQSAECTQLLRCTPGSCRTLCPQPPRCCGAPPPTTSPACRSG